ncbi:MAG: helix-turn-helix transcriptional regulator [Gemmatimonadota bacterium]|nr:helix-turn-helix transcriptional regulator [Gemmatimonadota bacterium]
MNASFLVSRIGAQQGLTQSQIAERVGAHPDHVAAWCRGDDCPADKHELLTRLANNKTTREDEIGDDG